MKYAEVESHTIEFKQEIPKNNQIFKTVVGFCNQAGGQLIIGVADDRIIVGLEEGTVMDVMEWLEHAIYSACTPPILPNIRAQRIADKVVIVITVSPGMNKPYYITSDGLENGVYIRIGRSTVRANADMVQELRWQSRGLSYDAMPVYQATTNDLNKVDIEQFFQSLRKKNITDVNDEVLKSYKLLIEEQNNIYPSVAGILLFGKDVNYWFSEAMIICSHFVGVSGREALASIDCTGPLIQQFKDAYHFVVSRLSHSFTITGPQREEKLEIPEIAIRELILNAVIHRNYHLKAPSKIAIYDDRIEIFSPGSFPAPISNLLLGLTDIRNMAICKVFREADYIEKLGSGFIATFKSYEERGLPRPEIINGDNYVKCILPREKYDLPQIENDLQNIMRMFLTLDDIAVSDVVNTIHLPRSTATRKLAELVSMKLLEVHGKGKGTRYRKVRS